MNSTDNKRGDSYKEKSPLPVFIKAENLPGDVTVYEICAAAEEISGPVTIDGAICISGLWRISPLYEASRIKILASGIPIRGTTVGVENINPFTLRGNDESASTKLYIGNLPFSYSSETIKKHLQAAGLTLRSNIVWEKARGPDGSLSDWKTGRRMVWINIPQKPINKFMRMGNGFSAIIYYKEMKDSRKCNKCLQFGHIAKFCEREEVCFTCQKPGHRKGDPQCDLGMTESDGVENPISELQGHKGELQSGTNGDKSEDEFPETELVSDEGKGHDTDTSISDWETSEEVDGNDSCSEINEQGKSEKPKKGVACSSGGKKEANLEKNIPKKIIRANQSNSAQSWGKGQKKKSIKKKSKKNIADEKGSPISSTLKQSQITEFTPGGKRDGSEVFSPDTVSSAHGPVLKKQNVEKANNV